MCNYIGSRNEKNYWTKYEKPESSLFWLLKLSRTKRFPVNEKLLEVNLQETYRYISIWRKGSAQGFDQCKDEWQECIWVRRKREFDVGRSLDWHSILECNPMPFHFDPFANSLKGFDGFRWCRRGCECHNATTHTRTGALFVIPPIHRINTTRHPHPAQTFYILAIISIPISINIKKQ